MKDSYMYTIAPSQFSVMSEFVSRHYDRGREVFESFFRALYVHNELCAVCDAI
jgi:hypothetical protein